MKSKKTSYISESVMTKGIIDTLKEKKKLPQNIWSSHIHKGDVDIKDIEFDVLGELKYGANEGIYLDMFLRGIIDESEEEKTVLLCTFKTLDESEEAFYEMAKLQASFILEARKYVNEHRRELVRYGYSCTKPEVSYGIWCKAKERALELLKDGYEVIDCDTLLAVTE